MVKGPLHGKKMGCSFRLILIITLLSITSGTAYPTSGEPPPPPHCSFDADVSACACSEGKRPFHGTVKCSIIYSGATRLVEATVESLYCMTYDWDSEELVTGKCLLANHPPANNLSTITISNVTKHMCAPTDHNGTLCGACDNNHALSINTFSLKCIPAKQCSGAYWLVYLLTQFFPLTVFYVLVIMFQINIVADWANLFIIFAQTISLPINLVTVERNWHYALGNDTNKAEILARVPATVYGIWNLEFSQGLIPPLCVDKSISALGVISLQYLSALYILLLVVVTYILIYLHGQSFKPIVAMWKPFEICFARFQQKLDAKTTVIHAFATFILLSYSKLAVTSFMLLAPTQLYNRSGDGITVLLFDGTVRYLQGEHRGYFAIAIIVLALFVLPLPLLLCLSPLVCFQWLLGQLRLRKQLIISFTDVLQGPFKNSTNGTTDRRFFAGFYFFLRLLVISVYTFNSDPRVIYLEMLTIVGSGAILVAIFQPYKRNLFNILDVVGGFYITFIIALRSYIFTLNDNNEASLGVQTFSYILIHIPFFVIFFYITGVLIHKLAHKQLKRVQAAISEILMKRKGKCLQREPSLPDRIMRPDVYDITYNSTDEAEHTENTILNDYISSN